MMPTLRQKVGKLGEDLAAAYLEQKGMVIVERNFRAGHGEIDIIALEGETLVFVEVKTARSRSFGVPELWADERKQRLISETADAYLFKKGLEQTDCRFDIVTVTLGGVRPIIRHIPNAFWAEE